MANQEFQLVNPYILGKMNTSFKGKSPLDAATKAYTKLSNYFNNDIPSFNFTLQKINSSSKIKLGGGRNNIYNHFNVQEIKDKNNNVKFKIKQINVPKNTKQMTQFKKELKKVIKNTDDQMNGGGKDYSYDDSDNYSWLDSDDEYVLRKKKSTVLVNPISYWWYDPYVYRIQKYYVPTFVAPLAPYITIPLYI